MKTIKIKDTTLDKIKELKAIMGSSSYDTLLNEVVINKILETHAYTQDGYLPKGAIVLHKEKVLAIKKVSDGRIDFDDGTYTYNGSREAFKMKLVSIDVDGYEGVK